MNLNVMSEAANLRPVSLCQQPRPRVDSPRRLIMLTNAQSHMPQRVMSVTDSLSRVGAVVKSIKICFVQSPTMADASSDIQEYSAPLSSRDKILKY